MFFLRKEFFEDYSEDNAREALSLCAKENEWFSSIFLYYNVKLLLSVFLDSFLLYINNYRITFIRCCSTFSLQNTPHTFK